MRLVGLIQFQSGVGPSELLAQKGVYPRLDPADHVIERRRIARLAVTGVCD